MRGKMPPIKSTHEMASPSESKAQQRNYSVHSAAFSVNTLLQRVTEEQIEQLNLETLEELTEENYSLQKSILSYRKHRHLTMNILERAHEALFRIQIVLEACTKEEESVGRDRRGFKALGEHTSETWI